MATAAASMNPSSNNALYARSPGVRLIVRPNGFQIDGDSIRWQNGQMVSQGTPSNVGQRVYGR